MNFKIDSFHINSKTPNFSTKLCYGQDNDILKIFIRITKKIKTILIL